MTEKKISKILKFYKKRVAEEESLYNEKLTSLDNNVDNFVERKPNGLIFELKDSLNKIYDTSNIFLGSNKIPLFIRRAINRIFRAILLPFFNAQREFNSQMVHLLNEYIEFNEEDRLLQKEIYSSLIQFAQRIIAMVDAKAIKTNHENIKLLLDYQKEMQEELKNLREILMISYEALDRKLLSFIASRSVDKEDFTGSVAKEGKDVRLAHAKSISENIFSQYFAFFNNTRGDEALIKERHKNYLKYIGKFGMVLDIGCGRGEFLELLKENGIDAYGIDINPEMVKRCKEKNLDARQEEMIEHLTKVPEDSLELIMCSYVIEHISFNLWFDFLKLSRRALMAGGLLIIETLNPRSLFGMIEWYWKDPTHYNPVYPEYFIHLLELVGFHDISISYYNEVPTDILLLQDSMRDSIHQENINKLNNFLFKPTEYSIIAFK